jgi:hypothetical protein
MTEFDCQQTLFDSRMQEGQLAHGSGNYDDARLTWQEAEELAPDALSKGRAIRGDASSAGRLGADDAIPRAEQAYGIHRQETEPPETASNQAWRERAESARVYGRMLLRGAIDQERRGSSTTLLGIAGDVLDDAAASMRRVTASEQPDQHDINLSPYLVISRALQGRKTAATDEYKRMRGAMRLSESPDLPTGARLSPAYTRKARLQSMGRMKVARTVTALATPRSSLRRSLALRLANNRFM